MMVVGVMMVLVIMFFSLFHTFTEVHFNAVMTIENKITTINSKTSYILCINAPHYLICSLLILFLKIY